MITLTPQRDMTAMALRLNIQDIDELVRGCRNVIEYRRPSAKWSHVFDEYRRTLRLLSEAQERALELGMEECPLAAPIAPLPMKTGWDEVLERVAPVRKSRAPQPIRRPSKTYRTSPEVPAQI